MARRFPLSTDGLPKEWTATLRCWYHERTVVITRKGSVYIRNGHTQAERVMMAMHDRPSCECESIRERVIKALRGPLPERINLAGSLEEGSRCLHSLHDRRPTSHDWDPLSADGMGQRMSRRAKFMLGEAFVAANLDEVNFWMQGAFTTPVVIHYNGPKPRSYFSASNFHVHGLAWPRWMSRVGRHNMAYLPWQGTYAAVLDAAPLATGGSEILAVAHSGEDPYLTLLRGFAVPRRDGQHAFMVSTVTRDDGSSFWENPREFWQSDDWMWRGL